MDHRARSGTTSAIGAAAAVSAAALCSAASAGAPMPGASSNDHLWFVVERNEPQGARITLYHHAREMGGSHLGAGLPLARAPDAMAAWGSQLWLVMPPQRHDRERRETFTVEVAFNPALGTYFYSPHDHLRVVQSLEGPGRLEGLAGTADGPVALIRFGPRDDPSGVRLLQLKAGRWSELALPDGFRAGSRCHLAAAGDDGRILVILNVPDRGGPPAVYWRDGGARWSQSAPAAELRNLCCSTRVGANVALIMEDENRLELSYLRPHRLLELADVTLSGRRWVVLGFGDGLRLIEGGELGDLSMRRIDAITGSAGPAQAMTPQPLMTRGMLQLAALLAIAILAALVVLAARPGPQWAPDLPAGVRVLGPAARLAALAVDLALGAAVSLAVLRCGLADLFRSPFLAADLAEAVPGLVLIGVTAAHSTIGELAFGRSVGKALVGARIAARDGSRPAAAAILLRNIFKALVLLIPVLAVFAFLNPNLQGPGDLVARTVVVCAAPAGPGDAPKGR